jgi:acetylornithine/succinyldiaminopimelate/putrescine aminotransferase
MAAITLAEAVPALPGVSSTLGTVNGNGVAKEALVEVTAIDPSEGFIEDEREYCPQGLNSLPIVVSRAKGAHLWSVDGRRYVDFMSAFAVTNQGHCHPRIIAALIEQAQKCTLTSKAFFNDQNSVLCKKLCKVSVHHHF